MRVVWNAAQYRVATGCQWTQQSKDFPTFTTVLDLINEALATASRLLSGRAADTTAGVIDSQSVKTTESGGPRDVRVGSFPAWS